MYRIVMPCGCAALVGDSGEVLDWNHATPEVDGPVCVAPIFAP